MKPGQLFWGVFFLALGGLFLFGTIGNIDYPSFAKVLKFWPIVFILIGASYLLKNQNSKLVINAAAGIFLALMILGAFSTAKGCRNIKINSYSITPADDIKDTTAPIIEKLDSTIRYINLKFDGGAGKYNVSSDSIYQYSLKSDRKLRKFDVKYEKSPKDSSAALKISMESFQVNGSNEIDMDMGINLKLSKQPIYNMKVGIGAAETDFDFSDLKISKLQLEIGAASLELKLPKPYSEEMKVEISGGAAKFDIRFPEDAAVQVRLESALSSVEIPDLIEKSKGLFESKNYAESKKKILLKISSGVSSINIEKYSK